MEPIRPLEIIRKAKVAVRTYSTQDLLFPWDCIGICFGIEVKRQVRAAY